MIISARSILPGCRGEVLVRSLEGGVHQAFLASLLAADVRWEVLGFRAAART